MPTPKFLARLRALPPARRPLAIAHRGGASIAPENTLFAFRRALARHRADMLELDVHATVDGVLVVAHDDDLQRCTDGHGAIADTPYADIARLDAAHAFTRDGRTFPQRGRGLAIPRLDDVLTAFPDALLNVELKPAAAGWVSTLVAAFRAAGALDRVCLGSEDDAVAGALFDAAPEACHYYPRNALTALVMALRSGEVAPRDDRFHVLDMPFEIAGVRLVDRALVERADAMGRWVNVWTVDEPNDMRALVAHGVGGIMSDRPDVLIEVLDETRR